MAGTLDDSLPTRCRALLSALEERDPDRVGISIASVARALKCARQTLYNHQLASEITEAAKRQNARIARERTCADDESPERRLTRQLAEAYARNRALVQERAIVEYNAMRLGIDPEELRRPIAGADRSVSRASISRHRSRQR